MKFYKYQGTGNDFVLIDNRKGLFKGDVQMLCDRKFGIGADGLMLLENEVGYDFKMVYYNSDGNVSTMCGNGGRCIVAFAKQLGIVDNQAHFVAIDGTHDAYIDENNVVALGMIGVDEVEKLGKSDFVLDTGSPHYVQFRDDIAGMNVITEAHKIRYNNRFSKEGINVNFVEDRQNYLSVRTYERGVENETLSCGTGVTAVAIAYHRLKGEREGDFTQNLEVQGGNLEVKFNFSRGVGYKNIQLVGPAELVFEGEV
jgi:diaminopimelate epimerase